MTGSSSSSRRESGQFISHHTDKHNLNYTLTTIAGYQKGDPNIAIISKRIPRKKVQGQSQNIEK